ncbi:UNVERIFIED_CONTAM: hypothetical protein Sangu_1461600 [Sesamum angustifolium]|uniref:Uncharacterized protein n=1 Tax=Sesamum angustifolium TaxID=2727405 RepID=A0AAW2N780_9LAMI
MLCVGRVLKAFEEASSLVVNLDKSSIAVSCNTSSQLQVDVACGLRVRVLEEHEKYLGFPTLVVALRRRSFRTSRTGYGNVYGLEV